jgi:hypothetical protein
MKKKKIVDLEKRKKKYKDIYTDGERTKQKKQKQKRL